jgi:hypothetical protein
VDWEKHRRFKFTQDDPPSHWPKGVRGISTNGLNLLGIHEKTGEIYWDGKEILVKRPFELGTVERWIAGLAALATFGVFILELGRTVWGWDG